MASLSTDESGDELIAVDGKGVRILEVRRHEFPEQVEVYNLSIGGSHTFYVGKSRVLVHKKMP